MKRLLVTYSGWLFALALLAIIAPRVYHRLTQALPFARDRQFQEIVSQKERELASTRWADARPLYIFAGDSHMEIGRWYDLFEGRHAIRNAGLSRARIADVIRLVAAISERQPETAVLMCGINDLGHGATVPECLDDYRRLIETLEQTLRPKRILVLSVLPLKQPPLDERVRALNEKSRELNVGLENLCARAACRFLDVTPPLTGSNGGLVDAFTNDGLHLNPGGYEKLSTAIAVALTGGTDTQH